MGRTLHSLAHLLSPQTKVDDDTDDDDHGDAANDNACDGPALEFLHFFGPVGTARNKGDELCEKPGTCALMMDGIEGLLRERCGVLGIASNAPNRINQSGRTRGHCIFLPKEVWSRNGDVRPSSSSHLA